MTKTYNDALEWAAKWIEDTLRTGPETNERTIEFGTNMAMTLRAAKLSDADLPRATADTFQSRVYPWLQHCFGSQIAADVVERNHRFLEEALELVQALGCTQSEAHQLVEYVFSRDSGNAAQEVGGVMVTLAALCLANDLDMHVAAESELERIWTKIEVIRAKQATKPPHSPLPAAPLATGETTVEAAALVELRRMFPDDRVEIAASVHGFSVSVWLLSIIPERKHYWPGISLSDCVVQVRAFAQTKAESGEK